MTLEILKQLVMKQAEKKGFGTTPDQISVPEKLSQRAKARIGTKTKGISA